MSGENRIELSYTPELGDLLHAGRAAYAKSWVAKLDKALAVVMLGCGIHFTVRYGIGLWVLLVALAPLEWFNLLSLQPLRIRYFYRRNPKYREVNELSFSPELIVYKTGTLESTLNWDFYNSWTETPRVFLLHYGKDMYSVVAKRAFRDETQLSSFRSLLKTKLG